MTLKKGLRLTGVTSHLACTVRTTQKQPKAQEEETYLIRSDMQPEGEGNGRSDLIVLETS